MKPEILTAEYLRECLEYDPLTGDFIWRARPVHHFKDASYQTRWNSRYAGNATGIISSISSNGYLRISIDNKKYYSHRLAWIITKGEWPQHVDHIDGCRTNNKLSNLRSVNRSENQRNQKLRSSTSSGHMGVIVDRRTGKFIAQIKVCDKRIHLGVFSDLSEAVKAREEANVKYGFHPNHGRKITEGA